MASKPRRCQASSSVLLDAVPVAQLIDVTMADRCQPQRTSSNEGLRDMGKLTRSGRTCGGSS